MTTDATDDVRAFYRAGVDAAQAFSHRLGEALPGTQTMGPDYGGLLRSLELVPSGPAARLVTGHRDDIRKLALTDGHGGMARIAFMRHVVDLARRAGDTDLGAYALCACATCSMRRR